jgi:hypothetical protein
MFGESVDTPEERHILAIGDVVDQNEKSGTR